MTTELKNKVFLLLILLCIALFNNAPAQDEKKLYIDNGMVRLGIDLESGGSIFYFSLLAHDRNLLNHYDRGRFIQQSYYGDEDGSQWGEKKWRWNPVQGGDYKGHPAKLVTSQSTDSTLYVKSIPKHWANGEDIMNASMEQWITLKHEMAYIRYKLTYHGDHAHEIRHQEMPAVFVDYALPNLVFYQGINPWTGDTLTSDIPEWPNESKISTENWTAYLDEKNWGIGVFTPGTSELTCYRYKGKSGPEGSGCSYFAPIRSLAIIPDIELEYDVYITIGSVEEIRNRFYQVHNKIVE